MRYLMKHISGVRARRAPAGPSVRAGLLLAGIALVLLGLTPVARADLFIIDFENTPALPAQPNNFTAAGAMQVITVPGVATIRGGVVLGNPNFLPAFAANGTPPNLYGTADPAIASPSLSRVIAIDIDPTFNVTSVSGVLFNGLTREATYTVEAFSGVTPVASQTFLDMPANFDSGFDLFSLSTTITRVTITPDDLAEWDYFVDTIRIEGAVIPEPASVILMGLAGASLLGYRWRCRRTRNGVSSLSRHAESVRLHGGSYRTTAPRRWCVGG